ncbi:MAG: L-seryl-tRNA(Sec) selenium transferase, partial [Clostridia bacterium]|nr:L-seryl-tRNA(Sec) selenium transferase [Clostridia bacterium]
YLDGTCDTSIPSIAMIKKPVEALDLAAKKLKNLLKNINGVSSAVMREKSQVGGGSVPGVYLDTRAVQVEVKGLSAAALEEKLRKEYFIICRVSKDKIVFDVRTLLDGDDKKIAEALRKISEELA